MDCVLMKFVIAFAPLFSKSVFERVKVLVSGAILSPASRTVTNALRVMGLSQEKHFQNYHRVLARARWSCLGGSKILLSLLIKVFGIKDELVIGFDDHLERRRGKKIKAKGIYRDAVRSSDSFFARSERFMVDVIYAFDRSRVWQTSLGITFFDGFMSVREVSRRARGIRHRKLTERARQAILWIWRWFPEKKLVFVGDASCAALDLLNAVREKVTVVTKLRLDAALYEVTPERRQGEMGRPRRKGNRLPTFNEVIKNPATGLEKSPG